MTGMLQIGSVEILVNEKILEFPLLLPSLSNFEFFFSSFMPKNSKEAEKI